MKKIILLVFLSVISSNFYAQSSNTITTNDSKINNLLEEKRKINSKITINDQYKVQIYHGDIETARKTLEDFNSKFEDYDGTIVFSSPNYKLWIGPFKNRIQATKAWSEIKESYSRALIIKPSK
ncbi:SPOR domain-containing protein [Flavobacterium agricola]|uniref:SPOR domain-containing protein n=1 Tax=Flavobacterium agricola TaxID=2870839 RepID=UPI002223A7A4|nr:SPOR domain-containing protein [Flavobacterium agricola]